MRSANKRMVLLLRDEQVYNRQAVSDCRKVVV